MSNTHSHSVNWRFPQAFAVLVVLTLSTLTGWRGGDFSYSLYRLYYYGQVTSGTVTERKVGGFGPTRYKLSYTFMGCQGGCQVSVDGYRNHRIGREVAIRYDPENLHRSWVEDDILTLFWGAILYSGTFCLVLASAMWLLSQAQSTEEEQSSMVSRYRWPQP